MWFNSKIISFLFFLTSILLIGCKENTSEPDRSQNPPIKEAIKEEKRQKDPRMSWQKPATVIAALGDISNKTVADLGAGIGYFAFKLLPKAQKVIAIDIDTQKIAILKGFKNSLNETLQNKFDIRLANPSNSMLNPNETDIIFIVNTIAYITPRVEYLRNLKKALKPGGQIFIVDYKNKRMPDFVGAPSQENRVYMNILEDELETAGYTLEYTDDTSLEYQYILVAKD